MYGFVRLPVWISAKSLFYLGVFHHAGNVVVPVLQNLQPRLRIRSSNCFPYFIDVQILNHHCFAHRVEHIAALDLLLQVNLLLLPIKIVNIRVIPLFAQVLSDFDHTFTSFKCLKIIHTSRNTP